MILKTLKRKYEGSIALLMVLFMSSILLVTIIGIALVSIDTQYISSDVVNRTAASNFAETCLEESVRKINIDRQYTGTFFIDYAGESCNVTISNTGTYSRQIDITSTSGNSSVQLSYSVDTSQEILGVEVN